jgi:hypothetical protein
MARRIMLVVGILIVALLAAVITLLATSGGGSSLTPNEKTTTSFYTSEAMVTAYHATLTALALIEQVTQTATVCPICDSEHTHAAVIYTQTISASTQQAILAQTATSAALTLTAAFDQTQTRQAAQVLTLRGMLRAPDQSPLPGVGLRLYRDDGDGRFTPFAPDAFLIMATTGEHGEYDFGALEPGIYWLELAYYSLPVVWQEAFDPDAPLTLQAVVPVADPVVFTLPSPFLTPSATPTQTATPPPTRTPSLTPSLTSTPVPSASATVTPVPSPVRTFALLITLTSTPEPGITQIPPTYTPTPEMIP